MTVTFIEDLFPFYLLSHLFLLFKKKLLVCCSVLTLKEKLQKKNSDGNGKDGPLGIPLAHREPDTLALYVAPSSLCFSSTPLRLPFSPGPAWGKLELFCSGEFLAGAVEAATVWVFISPRKEKRGGDEIDREAKKDWIEVVVLAGGLEPEKSLDTDCLVNRNPQRGRG